jgi:CBS domain containing-hemolysin-like protein
MEKQGDLSAKNLLKLKDNISGSIGTLVIMNNLFNIVGSILVGVVASDLFNQVWIGVYSGVFTFLVILFGEVLPKNFGEKNAIAFGTFVAPLIIMLSRVFSPVLFLLERLSESMFGKSKKYLVSEDEIRFMANLGAQEQSIEQDEELLIQNVFKMNDKTANDIMTPRVNIEALDSKLSLLAQKADIYNSSHSRLMIFGEDYDEILGFVLIREILHALAEGQGEKLPMDFIHPILTIKENTRVDSLLIMFQKKTLPYCTGY